MRKKLMLQALSECRAGLAIWIASGVLMAVLLWLYQIDTRISPLFLPSVFEPVLLYFLISLPFILLWVSRKWLRLERLQEQINMDHFSRADYPRAMHPLLDKIDALLEEKRKLTLTIQQENRDMQDYFTLWVHDAKLPVAAMSLLLEMPECDRPALQRQVKRMEQCVDNALTYIRLEGSDYRFETISVRELLAPLIRNASSQFISRHIRLNFEPKEQSVLTDVKWSRFILEQLLSNALKYAPDHSAITIGCHENAITILDEGPGIDEADLPRIFEKGFTGRNGHEKNAASSGMGLYLCAKSAKALHLSLSVANRPEGIGTAACLRFPQEHEEYE